MASTDTAHTTMTEVPPTTDEAKAKPGANWKAQETHVLPKNRLPIVFAGLMACTFLAALDQVRKYPIQPLITVFNYFRLSWLPHCLPLWLTWEVVKTTAGLEGMNVFAVQFRGEAQDFIVLTCWLRPL